ncbi:MAG: matrixin family metalloprotease [Nitrososphaerota archaeon]
MIVWSSSQASDIKVYFKNWSPTYLPAELDSVTSQTQVQEAWGLWHNEAPCVGFSETSSLTEGIHVSFSTSNAQFQNPMAGGVTAHAVENNKIVVSCSSCQNQNISRTEVIFNNTSVFKAKFIWTNDLSGLASDRVCFKSIALHEFGHVIGLDHCSNSSAVMYSSYSAGSNFIPPQPSDKDGLGRLCLATPTGPCQLPTPQNFTATIVGQNVVLNWGTLPTGCNGAYPVVPQLYKNGSPVSIPSNATSYTDVNAVSSLPASYYLQYWDNYYFATSNPSQTINVTVSPSIINTPTTWTGVVYVNSNVTVNSVLQIGASTNVVFQSGSSYGITLNSGLYVFGQSNGKVTFTPNSATPAAGAWGSITLNGISASNSRIEYADIKYGTQISIINANNVTIQNCNINNVTQGIYFSGSSNSSVINNTLTSSTIYHGIRFENGSTGITCIQNTSLNSFLTLCA